MSDHWMRWRAYIDELEDLMRWVADELACAERDAAIEHERETWPVSQRKARRVELIRRAMDMPFIGDLLEAANHLDSLEDLPMAGDKILQPWAEYVPDPPDTEIDLRSIVPPPPDATAPMRLRSAERALRRRTRSLVPVLENLKVPRNASAVIRTAEGLGLQELHFVHDDGVLVPQRAVTKRSEEWLDLVQSRSIESTLDGLKGRGYRVLVADHGAGSRPLEQVELGPKVAVVLGSEQVGVSDAATECADALFHVPSLGFTSYLNVSVAAGICLYGLDRRMQVNGQRSALQPDDLARLRCKWYRALARGNVYREAEYLRWLHTPPEPAEPGRAGGAESRVEGRR